MKRAIIKGCIFAVTFVAALIVSSLLLNKGNTDMTAEVAPPSLPILFLDTDGRNVNMMRGYLTEMDEKYMRADILPIDETRRVVFGIKEYGLGVESVSYQVRSLDGERLVEDTPVSGLKQGGELIRAEIFLKDLIEPGQEYGLSFQVRLENGQEASYYTRVIQAEDYRLNEKLDFVSWFSDTALEGNELAELKTYLESNRDGDNTTFGRIDIHSSLSQVGWGDLEVKRITKPVFNVGDITEETAAVTVEYLVEYLRYERKAYAEVSETFRMRTGTERMYLLDYERTMDEMFEAQSASFVDDNVVLGILEEKPEMVESEGGKIIAFEQTGVLYSLNTTDHKLSHLFSAYDAEAKDERALRGEYEFRILQTDEMGNVFFMVVGYIPRGRMEGNCGVQVYYYNSGTNAIEEMAFWPSEKAPQLLMAEMELLSGLNGRNQLYVFLNDQICCIDLEQQQVSVIAENRSQDSCRVSESSRSIVWQNDPEEYACRSLTRMNLNSGKQTVIEAEPGCFVYPLGFMGEDLVYGVARSGDVTVNNAGKMLFPMYQVRIVDENGRALMTYEKPGIYVLGCRMRGNQILLETVEKDSAGEYSLYAEDQIVSGTVTDSGVNRVQTLTTEEYGKLMTILLPRNIDGRKIKFQTPKEVLYEGSRSVTIPASDGLVESYYVYGLEGDVTIFSNPGEAVRLAYEISGVVLDQSGFYIWRKERMHVRNQIMAITGSAAEDGESALAVCLDAILDFEGAGRRSQELLNRGDTIAEILEGNLPGVRVLDLENCTLASVLYFPDREIPVLATLADGNAVLITGFNEQNVVVMNPENGQVYKVGMNDATEWFAENGNMFVAYQKGEG